MLAQQPTNRAVCWYWDWCQVSIMQAHSKYVPPSQGAGSCPPPSPHPIPSQSHGTNWQEYWKCILQVIIFFGSFKYLNCVDVRGECCFWGSVCSSSLLRWTESRESGWREFLYYQIKCLFLVLNDKIWVFSSEILGTISYREDIVEILFYSNTDIIVICCLHTTAQLF